MSDTTAVLDNAYANRARSFCENAPYTQSPYDKRNWGGVLHSLCSYQGKLKPSIAHFLVSNFTNVGDVVLDPMAGVGTIPLEARRQGRIGLAGDLSPLAVTVSKAKLAPLNLDVLKERYESLRQCVENRVGVDLTLANFGLNGAIKEYFHPDTLAEVLAARQFFISEAEKGGEQLPEDALLQTSLMHILHGNRPYALSRRSHSLTPFAPSGDFEYRGLLGRLNARLDRTLPHLVELGATSTPGRSVLSDFRDMHNVIATPVDAIITSPPFTSSFRFWSTNWMRLWFSGWSECDFKERPREFLEAEQLVSMDPYAAFMTAAAATLAPSGRMILHLGENRKQNMAEAIVPLMKQDFNVEWVGRESISGESHGMTDKGGTVAHWYVFATKKN